MPQCLSVDSSDRVATVTLRRPEVHNALNVEMLKEIGATLTALGRDESVRVVVIRGDGKSFCAGADIKWMQSTINCTAEENFGEGLVFADMMHSIRLCPKPVIARVHGAAYGGGVGIVAACDMACALASARFSLSEVRLGLIPSVISPFCLERMGMTAYRRYALTAEAFDGTEAKRVGLVCECVASETEQDAWITNMVGLLKKNGPQAMRVCKSEAQAVAGTPWDQLRERTARAIADIRVTAEGQEGLKAFLEKRPPNWVT